jgi:hypothetical protein
MTKLRIHAQNDPTLEEVKQRLEELRLLLKDPESGTTWEQVESEYASLIRQKLRLELASMAINQPRTWGI